MRKQIGPKKKRRNEREKYVKRDSVGATCLADDSTAADTEETQVHQ